LPRGVVRAFAISLLLHVFLLWPAPSAWRDAVPAAPLMASLRPLTVPGALAASATVSKPVTAGRSEKAAKQTPQPLAIPDASGEMRPAVPSSLTETIPARSGDAPVSAAAARPAISAALPTSDGVDADGLRSYRLALAREARRFKRYPSQAVDAQWSGTAELRVTVQADGVAMAAELAKSSGHAALDDAALDMLRHALPVTPVPVVLRGRAFAVNLPVMFELPD
jgi:periplasmic protein TonB